MGTVGLAEAMTYLEPFPANGTKYEVGRGGRALWSRDGKELFLIPAPGEFKVVTVQTEPTVEFTPPLRTSSGASAWHPGQPAAVRRPAGRPLRRCRSHVAHRRSSRTQQINVILNWFEELKARVPIPK